MVFGNKNSLWGKGEKVFNTTLGNDLLCCLKLDETSGIIAEDAHKLNDFNNNSATINEVGKINKSYLFESSNNSYLNSSSIGSYISNNNAITISFWIKSLSASKAIIDYNYYPNYDGFYFGTNGGKYYLRQRVGALKNEVLTPLAYNDNTWRFVIIQIDKSAAASSQSKIWINDVNIVGSGVKNTIPNTNFLDREFNIGVQSNYNNYYDGNLDQISVWNRLLTSTEKTLLYNSNSGLNFNNW